MAENQTTVAVESNEAVDKALDFWAKFSKPIIYVGSAIIILSVAWIVYKNFFQAPKEAKATEVIFPAQNIFGRMTQTGFSKDSVNLVLNGGNGVTGVLKIAKNYSGTDAGELANYMAGACYLRIKDYNNAIKYLKDFSSDGNQVQAKAYQMLGDAYGCLKNNEEAYGYYKKAIAVNAKDELIVPAALYNAANIAEVMGKQSEAVELFKKIKDEFPRSNEAIDVDKHLAKLGVFN